MENGLLNIEGWKNRLGLFPFGLFKDSKTQYILLNGSYNSFCIDFESQNIDPQKYFNNAWSSDVESYLKIHNDSILVYKWGKISSSPEDIKIKKINENLESFYEYLGKGQYGLENSIVPFVMRIYAKLRNLVGEADGKNSLKALIYLLAAAYDNVNVDLSKWGLDNTGKELLTKNGTNILDLLINEFKNGISYKGLKPNLDLLLRHTSGRLFQEAHYKALINPQTDLWGLPDNTLIQKNNKILSGAYFTPSYLARILVEECLYYIKQMEKKQIFVFDPACGSGEFLKEVLRQLRLQGYYGKIILKGWDISESAIDMAKFILNCEKTQWKNGNTVIDIEVVEDSLSSDWPKNVDLLIMNPPYQSWELLDNKQREIVRNALGNLYFKNPNISSAFIWKGINEIKKDGIIGCIFPSSILNADSYQTLRSEISKNVCHKLIGKLGNYIFYGALVDASIFVAQKTDQITPNDKIILWANNIKSAASNAIRGLRKHHTNNNTIINEENFSIYRDCEIGKQGNDLSPISYNNLKLKYELEKQIEVGSLVKINDLFYVRQGVRSGKNRVFLIDKYFYNNNLRNKEKAYFRPAITNQAIKNGLFREDKYIWYPYGEELKPIKKEKDLIKFVSSYYKLLCKYKTDLKNRKEVQVGKYSWWDLTRERSWQSKREHRLISTEFGKSDSFAFDESGEYVVERGNAWIPKKEFHRDLYLAYLSIFCSTFFNDLLSIYSKQIAGGMWYLGSKHVSNIPIPDFRKETFSNILLELVRFGEKISKGVQIDYKELSELVRFIYKIN
jgi:predicted RNA methylase